MSIKDKIEIVKESLKALDTINDSMLHLYSDIKRAKEEMKIILRNLKTKFKN